MRPVPLLASVSGLMISATARADMAPRPEQPGDWNEHPPPPPDPERTLLVVGAGVLLALARRQRGQLALVEARR